MLSKEKKLKVIEEMKTELKINDLKNITSFRFESVENASSVNLSDDVDELDLQIIYLLHIKEKRDNERYHSMLDLGTENGKGRAVDPDDDSITDPIEMLEDPNGNVELIIEMADVAKEEIRDMEKDALIQLIREKVLPELTENQLDLFYKMFAENKTQYAIAGELGISRQAVNKRVKQLIKKAIKLMGLSSNG